MNVIARLQYELAYDDSAVHRFNYYTTRTPPQFFFFFIVWWLSEEGGFFYGVASWNTFIIANSLLIFSNANFVEYNRHSRSTYFFFVDPFILPYWFYNIRRELIDTYSIIVYFPSTFSPTLVHHQRRMYYKSVVTFVCTLLLCKKKSIWAVAVCSVYF